MAKSEVGLLVRAAAFAAEQHRGQRRMGSGDPYVNHPLSVARRLVETGGVDDAITLAAAMLHDVVEDTNASVDDVAARFGTEVASIVAQVSDDQELDKVERKREQIRQVGDLSPRAKLVKLADKLDNLTDLAHTRPPHWDEHRVRGYFVWSHAVVTELRGTNPALEAALDELFRQHVPAGADARAAELAAYLAAMGRTAD